MGSWNATCGLTSLPILSGEQVYVFPIVEDNAGYRTLCYSHALFRPCRTPFLAEYNDYGAGENCSGVMLPHLMEGIKRSLVEMEAGENQYHDIPVKRDGFDIDLFFNAVHENRLKIQNNRGGESNVYFTMVRKDVVDRIWNENVNKYYHNFGDVNNRDYRYVSTTYAELFKEMPKYLAECWEIYSKKSEGARMFGNFFTNQTSLLHTVISEEWSIRGTYVYNLTDFIEVLTNTYSNDKEMAIEMMRMHLIGNCVEDMMSETRKVWLPVTHQGSQSQSYDKYQFLNKIAMDIISDQLAEFALDDGGDEEK